MYSFKNPNVMIAPISPTLPSLDAARKSKARVSHLKNRRNKFPTKINTNNVIPSFNGPSADATKGRLPEFWGGLLGFFRKQGLIRGIRKNTGNKPLVFWCLKIALLTRWICRMQGMAVKSQRTFKTHFLSPTFHLVDCQCLIDLKETPFCKQLKRK